MKVIYLKNCLFLLSAIFTSLIASGALGAENGRIGLFHAKISPDGTHAVFTWQGDIWLAEIASGNCTRITNHIAYDQRAVWFPDGKRIAFSSNRDGNDDIYSVSIHGGEPTRHTWYGGGDIALGISPDGKNILFRSSRRPYSIDLYEVNVAGGIAKPITSDAGYNLEASYSFDGKHIVVSRGGINWIRRGYRGSADSDIYVMRRDGSEMKWLENGYDGIDYWPCYSPDDQTIYFVSDRELNTENVYRISLKGGKAERITSFKGRPVHWLSIAKTGRLCFVQDFQLWIMDPGKEPIRVNLKCDTEPKRSNFERADIQGSITEMEVSPLGTYVAIIARGELYVTPLRNPDEPAPLGDTKYFDSIRISDTPAREAYVSWHPDGDRLVVVSDKDGNNEIYEIDLRKLDWTRLTRTTDDEYFPTYSPDGKKLAFYRGKRSLIVRELDSGKERRVVDDLLVEFPYMSNYRWSPDSRWIAYNGNDETETSDIFIVFVEPGEPLSKPINVTCHHDYDGLLGWTKNGKDLVFISGRRAAYGLNPYAAYEWGGSIYSLPLQHSPLMVSGKINLPEKETEDKNKDEKANDKAEGNKEDKKIEINFERINERARLISAGKAGGWAAALSPDDKTLLYESSALGRSGLWSIPYDGGEATFICWVSGGVNYMEWLPDGSGAVILSGGKLFRWKKGGTSLSGIPAIGRFTVNLKAERKAMVNEAARVFKNHFYDPKMHGHNWESIIATYAPIAEEASVPEEFELILEMMFGELGASHIGAYGETSFEGIGANVAMLGIDFETDTTGPGLKVKSVLPRGPADYEATQIKVGEWVLKINNQDVSLAEDYMKILDDMAERMVTLTVSENQTGENIREVNIVPLPLSGGTPLRISWFEANYRNWVDIKRKIVEEKSKGEIGYIHIPNMRGEPLEEFARQLFSENYNKKALVLDVRWNTGGNIHEYLLDILSREKFGYAMDREGKLIQQPPKRWGRPIVLLINEYSFSDAEIFPEGFKRLRLGTVMGVATSGGVIGTVEYPLVNGTAHIRIPRVGWYTADMKNMENLGIQPDIKVEADLNHIRDGIDDQLNAAVEYLIKQIN